MKNESRVPRLERSSCTEENATVAIKLAVEKKNDQNAFVAFTDIPETATADSVKAGSPKFIDALPEGEYKLKWTWFETAQDGTETAVDG